MSKNGLSQRQKDEYFMRRALDLARQAEAQNEVPIGALIVKEDEILGEGWNRSISEPDPTAHAEVQAIRMAAKNAQNYRLSDATLYVTIEPCVMCVGAILHARIKRVVYGAVEPKMGAIDSRFLLLEDDRHFHRVQTQGNLLGEEARALIQNFFKRRRAEKKA